MLTPDRVLETSATTGTGTISLAGAKLGFRTFVAGVGSGNPCWYVIDNYAVGEWEVGRGTVTSGSPDILTRSTVLASSNSNNLVSFTAGTKNVYVPIPGCKVALLDQNGYLSNSSGTALNGYLGDWGGAVGGTANAITLTPSVALGAYVASVTYTFIATATNTLSDPTVAVSGLPAKTIKSFDGSALPAGAIVSGALYTIKYDGTYFRFTTPVTANLAVIQAAALCF